MIPTTVLMGLSTLLLLGLVFACPPARNSDSSLDVRER